MRLRLAGVLILALGVLPLLTLPPAFGQETPKVETKKPWTGKLKNGQIITQTDLDKILKAHFLWIWSGFGKEGQRADLSEANLTGAQLSGANLSMANLRGAKLYNAKLNNAILHDTNLIMAELTMADLKDSDLAMAQLDYAQLFETDLRGANLMRASVKGAIFEPKPGSLPAISKWYEVRGLSSIVYLISPQQLVELREAFKKAGMRDQEREVTFALNHVHRVKIWDPKNYWFQEVWKNIRYTHNQRLWDNPSGKMESIFNLVFFEWTCGYGLYPGRPLKILILGLFIFSLFYMLALGSCWQEAGIWVVFLQDRVSDKNIEDRPVKLTWQNPFLPMSEDQTLRFRTGIWRFLRIPWLGFYLSLLSAFSLGWRELNVGNWITRMQKREYSLRATGWVRTVAGLQSLLSVYMLALWVLTYFGRPFD
ncbi:MAG: pentapeptide repeat-containing protein [Desulfobaccales bacterium]